MTVTIQNHVYPQPCEPDATTATDLVLAAEQLRACLPADVATSSFDRRGRVRRAIEGLIEGGVRPGAVPGWLLVILALVELLPDVLAVIKKIIDAINGGLTPAEVMAEYR